MNLQNALDILGINLLDSEDKVKSNYRALVLKNHPDRGGDLERMKSINGAYDFMRKNKVRIDEVRSQYRMPSLAFGGIFEIISAVRSPDAGTSNYHTFWGATAE